MNNKNLIKVTTKNNSFTTMKNILTETINKGQEN